MGAAMTDTTDKTILLDEAPTQTNLLARFSQYMVSFAERWFPERAE